MAATLDANVGTKNQQASTTCTLVTGATVASGALLIVGVGDFGVTTITQTTSGGLTWSNLTKITSGSINAQIWYAFAPSGLASGTSLVWTSSLAVDWLMGGFSLLGIDTSGTVVAQNGTSASTTAFSTGSMAAGTGNAVVGVAFEDGSGTATSTITTDTQINNFNNAAQTEAFTMGYDLNSSGSDSIVGNWSTAVSHCCAGGVFKAAAGAAAASLVIPRRGHRGLYMR